MIYKVELYSKVKEEGAVETKLNPEKTVLYCNSEVLFSKKECAVIVDGNRKGCFAKILQETSNDEMPVECNIRKPVIQDFICKINPQPQYANKSHPSWGKCIKVALCPWEAVLYYSKSMRAFFYDNPEEINMLLKERRVSNR